MRIQSLKSICLFALVILPGCMMFRACGGNHSVDRPISPDEIVGEWYLDNSAIESARRMMVNTPGYVIDDNGKSNRIVLNKDGTCIVNIVDLASYDSAKYFEKSGAWTLTNIPYSKSSTRANNVVIIPWDVGFETGMRMRILEEDGALVLYHYIFRDEDIGVIVKYRRL